jgi:hypothetical protein
VRRTVLNFEMDFPHASWAASPPHTAPAPDHCHPHRASWAASPPHTSPAPSAQSHVVVVPIVDLTPRHPRRPPYRRPGPGATHPTSASLLWGRRVAHGLSWSPAPSPPPEVATTEVNFLGFRKLYFEFE